MITSFYTAGTATVQTQKGMDVLANNVANVSTAGYKTQLASFSDLLYTNMKGEGENLRVGHGTKLSKTDTLFQVGMINNTGRDLDFALTEANAFFGVSTPEGIMFTRAGNFYYSEQQNGEFYLATASGDPVLDRTGAPIVVDPQNPSEAVSRIGVFNFDNIDGLSRVGEGYYAANATSGPAYVVENPPIEQYKLEGSSVDLADQMTEIIKSQRAFQFNTRMVQISDEIMQTINNIR